MGYYTGIIVLVGNIGTGKSTFAKNYKAKYFDKRIYPHEMDGYANRNLSDPVQYFDMVKNDLRTGLSFYETVIADGTHITRKSRTHLIELANEMNASIVAVDFGAGDETSLNCRLQEPRNTSSEEWIARHQSNKAKYEPPSLEEGFLEIVRI